MGKVADGVRSIHIPVVSLEDKYLTPCVPSLAHGAPTCLLRIPTGIGNLATTTWLCLQPVLCSRIPTWMCLLLLKLLPLFTGSVLWVEGLPLVISGDDLPMEWALYNKHRAVDGQEVAQTALGTVHGQTL